VVVEGCFEICEEEGWLVVVVAEGREEKRVPERE